MKPTETERRIQQNEQERERYGTDPAYRERHQASSLRGYHQRVADPERRAAENARQRERYRTDPQARNRKRAYSPYSPHKRATYLALRNQVIGVLGSRCALCGIASSTRLHVHHINNDGKEHRLAASSRNAIYREIVSGVDLHRYRLLCAKCHKHEHKPRGEPAGEETGEEPYGLPL